MPSRLHRHQDLGHHHFITFSCDDRNPYLQSIEAKSVFQDVLESTRKLYEFQIAGYVIMPEHVHLLVSKPTLKPLATALAILKRSVSHRRPEKPFWLTRYYDFNVSENDKLLEKLKYIHRNPVHRGLAAKPEDYQWSSFRTYAFHEQGPVTITRCT